MELKRIVPVLVIIAALSIAIMSSGCASQKKELKYLKIGEEEYFFNSNLYDAIKYPVSNPEGIKSAFDDSEIMCIVFDESSGQDNAYFAVVSYNIVFKITRHYTNMGKDFGFSVCNGYNLSDLRTPFVTLKGPETGATENSITLNGNEIVLQGLNSTKLQEAGDRLVLAVFGIETLE